MRTPLLLIGTLLLSTAHAQVVLVDEDFDSYTNGAFLAQSAGAPWTTWSAAPGTPEDATISNEQSVSGDLSGKWVSTSANGGPTDIVIPLGNQTTGVWLASFNMYIPDTKGGYFNILHNFAGGSSVWAVEVYLNVNGDIGVGLQGQNTVMGTYPHDTWFPVNVVMDLDNDQAALVVNGTLLNTWTFSWDAGSTTPATAQLGGLNFYAYAGGGQTTYYIDDLFVGSIVVTDVAEHGTTGFGLFPNPVADQLTVVLDQPSQAGLWAIHDATGRTVRSGNWASTTAREVLDVADLPGGVYTFALMVDGQRHVQRLVKP